MKHTKDYDEVRGEKLTACLSRLSTLTKAMKAGDKEGIASAQQSMAEAPLLLEGYAAFLS